MYTVHVHESIPCLFVYRWITLCVIVVVRTSFASQSPDVAYVLVLENELQRP